LPPAFSGLSKLKLDSHPTQSDCNPLTYNHHAILYEKYSYITDLQAIELSLSRKEREKLPDKHKNQSPCIDYAAMPYLFHPNEVGIQGTRLQQEVGDRPVINEPPYIVQMAL
jgi:hypothetical protein